MRRTLHLCAAASLLLLGLAACDADDDSDPTAAPTTTTEESSPEKTTEQETTEDETTEESTEDPTESESEQPSDDTEEPSDTESSGGDSSDPGDAPATEVATIWVDDSWSIEKHDEDVCAGMGLTTSSFSQQDHVFTCGPTAANAMACYYQDGGRTTCIVDPLGKKAIRFDSPTVDNWDGELGEREGDPIPMYVELADGTTCSVAAHDQGKHWNGKFSWYSCDDGSELLTDESIDNTFDREGDTWTVQRSVDKKKPTDTAVKTATFAGV